MPWFVWLSAADEVALADRYPGLSYDEIAARAVKDPRYGHLFDRFDPDVYRPIPAGQIREVDLYRENVLQRFCDLVVNVMLADEPPDAAPVETAPATGDSNRGGRPWKLHPGLALREAARLIVVEQAGDSRLEREVTAFARERIDPEMEPRMEGWEFKRSDGGHVAVAIDLDLLRWTPRGGLEKLEGVREFRKVDDFEWLVVPRPK